MPNNKYCNLDGTLKIKDTYGQIKIGFDGVEADANSLQSQITADAAALQAHKDSLVAHLTSKLTNDSQVLGTKASDALNTLKGAIEAIVAAAANAQIGVYSLAAAGTNTYTSTSAGLTYFAGLKVNLTIANTNTGASSWNLNTLGAVAIKKKDANNVKYDVSAGDLPAGYIAQLEHDGTDLILLNKEVATFSPEVTTPANVISYPSTAKEGPLKTDTRKGRTYTNLMGSDGDFETDGTLTRWVDVGAGVTKIRSSTPRVFGSSSMRVAANGTIDAGKYVKTPFPFVSGHVYFISASMCTNDTVVAKIKTDQHALFTAGGTANILIKNKALFTATTDTEIWVGHMGGDLYAFIDGLIVVDLTAQGDTTIDLAILDNRYTFINGTKGTGPKRTKNTNVNIIDGYNNSTLQKYGKRVFEEGRNCWKFFHSDISGKYILDKFLPNTRYTIKFTYKKETGSVGVLLVYIDYTDGTTSWSSSLSATTFTSLSYTSEVNKSVKRVYFIYSDVGNTFIDIDTLVINQGTTATYIPHEETNTYTPPLGSLPDGTQDTWNSLDGTKTQNVANVYTLLSSDITSLTTVDANVDRVNVANAKLIGCVPFASDSVGKINVFGYTEIPITGFDAVANIGKVTVSGGAQVLSFLVAKGTYADLAAAQAAFTGKQLQYKLAQPIVSTIDGAGQAKSYPGGMQIDEPVIRFDAKPVGGVITILDPTYPIKTVETVVPWTTVNGQRQYGQPLVIASNTTTTITATGAVDTLDYEVRYYYPEELSSQADKTYSFYTNWMGQLEGLLDQVARLGIVVDDLIDFVTAMFLQQIGTPQTLSYQVEDLGAGADIASRLLMNVPAGYAITGITAEVLSQGAPAGIDNSNTCVIALTDGTNTIVTKTYNASTVFPTNDVDDLGALSTQYKVLTGTDKLKLSVTNGATANPPAFILQFRYTIIKIA